MMLDCSSFLERAESETLSGVPYIGPVKQKPTKEPISVLDLTFSTVKG